MTSDVTRALYRVCDPAKIGMAELAIQACAYAMQCAKSGERRRIATAAAHLVNSDDAICFEPEQVHVIDICAQVLRSDETSAQRSDETAESAKEGLAFICFGVADQYRF